MSGGLAPSRSTVYVSNIPFELSNNDLHKVFEKYGKIVKVTVLKNKKTRRSKGVAFIMFMQAKDAQNCVEATNLKEMFGRTLKASIAKDNGRAVEFIRRKEYPDKTKCFECGEYGHLSYKCSQNMLGERQPPPKKIRKRKKKMEPTGLSEEQRQYFDSSDSDNSDLEKAAEADVENLSAAIALEQQKQELEDYRYRVATGNYSDTINHVEEPPKKIIRPSNYFSDEEEIE